MGDVVALRAVLPSAASLGQASIEASRHFLAAHLRHERAVARHARAESRATAEAVADAEMWRDDALQVLRDILWDERRAQRREACRA